MYPNNIPDSLNPEFRAWEELQEIPEVICVVTELEKAESVYIALKEGLITALVTDVRVVKKVLEYRAKEGKEKEDESEEIKK